MFNTMLYNPDVLSCLANLSSDEVFTPPKLVNEILDLLPGEIWQDKTATFLDPCSKSGVFLREIAKRLLVGLEGEIPHLQARIDHIFQKQLYGIAITELTAHLSRRSVYCSKRANGRYSVTSSFSDEQGNIRFERVAHTWASGRCVYCGASQAMYDREAGLETHAYQFIHKALPEELKNMKFDVIIGNPPYQLSDGGGGGSAVPIYDKFVEKAKKMNPRFIIMIIPARWYSGGRGLDAFRDEMLNDNHISKLIDYPNSSDCFPDVQIKGGICYFLWDRENSGLCEVKTIRGEASSVLKRALLEGNNSTFLRYNESIPIYHKIKVFKEPTMNTLVSSMKPFGLRTYFQGEKEYFKGAKKVYSNKAIGYVNKNEILNNIDWIDKYKVYITRSYGAGEEFPHQILNKPILGEPNTCCTETYLVIGPFSSKNEAENVIGYISTKFFRFLVLLLKNTQDAPQKVYSFVPIQDFSKPWTDEELYEKYHLTEDEITFIESMIKPMVLDNGDKNA